MSMREIQPVESEKLECNSQIEVIAQDLTDDLNQSYPQGIKLAAIVASLAISVFLCALDETIITTATPRITDEFKSINDVGCFMTFAAFQLIYGKLFLFYSIKHVFLTSIVIFELGSLLCAVAPTSIAFIVG
ncbi:hypothetical protein F4815DRAFT_341829 [Daldinia loculata]|nr:hypothetical protein F4815DRAFT_341829 [Daldinia loculata]